MQYRTASARPRLGFVMEQTLGHVTHYANLRRTVEADARVSASWYPLSFDREGPLEHMPFVRSNWSARSSWRVRKALSARTVGALDALFFHTQVPTLLAPPIMRRVPSIVSLDATPINLDSVGSSYGHHRGNVRVEGLKHVIHLRALRAATAYVTWSEWVRTSLIDDYGIQASRIQVVPPGVDLSLWPARQSRTESGAVRLLFVGGDFYRKGGHHLLEAVRSLSGHCELHVVTKTRVPPSPGVIVYNDIEPNSAALRHLYSTADVFVLPTLADCLPLVVQEAMAAGLPVVSSDVGAIGEAVRNGDTGLLVSPGDVRALRDALLVLVGNGDRRTAMGERGRCIAEERFDSAINGRRILQLMIDLVERRAA